ncbi:MAG: TRAP transporter large permease subunit, partial [Rhodospirillales bacterium]
LGATMRKGGVFLIPLVVITWTLLEGYTPTYAGIYGTLSVIIVSMFRRETRLTPSKSFDIRSDTCVKMVAVTGACAAAGLVIGGITMTGLASKFSTVVFLISGEHLLTSLLVAAGLTILLGMGMPTPSAYILAAVLIAPVMADLGVPVMGGHLFLLYFAVMSALTPPVAVAAYAAAAIADEAPLKIAGMAVRIAIGAFIVPFTFIYDPALILEGTWIDITSAFILVSAGLIVFVVGQEGYFRVPLGIITRLGCILAGFALMFARPLLGFVS